jgi:hypothetical protein
MHAETETSFLTNLNQNIGIVHQVCHTYFRRDAVEREDVFQDIMYQLWKSHPQFKGESSLYSFLTHTLVRHWGDMRIMVLCLAGAAFYIPLTVALIRRVGTLYRRPSEAPGSTVPDVFHKVEREYARLADFFHLKKRMDWIGVPVSCAIIVLVTFTLFVKGGVERNPLAGLAVFALWVGMSLIAIHAENKKRFIAPLRHLEQVLDDLKNS